MKEITLSDFLDYFDFSFTRGLKANGEFVIQLVDNQGANLGDIESDEFYLSEENPTGTIIDIIERLDTYVYDYIIRAIQDHLDEKEMLWGCTYSLEELVKICNANGIEYTEMANYILDPSLIKIDSFKINGIESNEV